MASAACMKTAGVPVELRVATIFCAIMALLPIPVIITLPSEKCINFTLSIKSPFINVFSVLTDSASMSMVLKAISTIS
ncbi:MAG: hypothetical protein BWY67_02146 [Bacteroidetes bacterium ADurb.Bin397]|nr:MAG: hypothetical protein BWY67_02146 [Bacteroidetes bacterium ADurb.Bin397]